METLVSLVRRVGTILARWVPVGIDHGAVERVVLRLEPLVLSVVADEGGAVVAADVERDVVGVCAVLRVAVDAGARRCLVVEDRALVEVAEVALVDAHVAIDLVARGDATVGQSPFVEGVGTDRHLEVFVLCPASVVLHTYGERQVAAFVLLGQCMPVVDIEVDIIAVGVQLTALTAFDDDVDAVVGAAGEVEVHWCDACGNRHAGIFRIDGRQFVHHCSILRGGGARGEEECRNHEKHEIILSTKDTEATKDVIPEGHKNSGHEGMRHRRSRLSCPSFDAIFRVLCVLRGHVLYVFCGQVFCMFHERYH